MIRDKGALVVASIVVGIATLLVYLRTLSCGFINLDDPFYINNNPLIKSLDPTDLWRMFSQAHLGAWLPLTYVSFAVDYHFWGNNSTGYHLTNILLHATNATLVVLLADRLLKWPGHAGLTESRFYPLILVLAGLLWGVHPLRVESVAWAAERKDVLNGLFSIAAMLSYVIYAKRKEQNGRGVLLPYALALFFLTLSLLAKQVSVTLPVIMLILDWYPLNRLRNRRLWSLILEKLPFFAVAMLIAVVTIYFAMAEKMLISSQDMPLYVRAFASGNAIFEYCRLSLVPLNISPYFVLHKPLPYGYLVKTAAVVLLTLLLIGFAGSRKGVAATWLAFIILLFPMLSFVQAGDDIALATRYTYLPAIPLSMTATGALLLLADKWANKRRGLLVACLGGMILFIAGNIVLSLGLIKAWQDTGTFWSRVIGIEPTGRAYGDRGVFYLINGRSSEAVRDFDAAIAIAEEKKMANVYNLYAFRGLALSDVGRYGEAVADFDRAIALYPHPTYFKLRGTALQAMGRLPESAHDFRTAGPNPPPIDWFEKK